MQRARSDREAQATASAQPCGWQENLRQLRRRRRRQPLDQNSRQAARDDWKANLRLVDWALMQRWQEATQVGKVRVPHSEGLTQAMHPVKVVAAQELRAMADTNVTVLWVQEAVARMAQVLAVRAPAQAMVRRTSGTALGKRPTSL